MSLIEKIDKLYNPYGNGEHYEGYKRALDQAKEIILSEQKKPCKGCIHNDNYENELEYGYSSPCTKCKRRCIDNYLNQPIGNTEQLTIGDKIRESNESVARFIYQYEKEHQYIWEIEDYLNQPYTE